jgi:hypothetical protein
MAEQNEPQDLPDDAAAPVPNRRDRRGGRSGASVPHRGRSAVTRRSGSPTVPPRQYSTRRRSG